MFKYRNDDLKLVERKKQLRLGVFHWRVPYSQMYTVRTNVCVDLTEKKKKPEITM